MNMRELRRSCNGLMHGEAAGHKLSRFTMFHVMLQLHAYLVDDSLPYCLSSCNIGWPDGLQLPHAGLRECTCTGPEQAFAL
jgi:hypothetical protein